MVGRVRLVLNHPPATDGHLASRIGVADKCVKVTRSQRIPDKK